VSQQTAPADHRQVRRLPAWSVAMWLFVLASIVAAGMYVSRQHTVQLVVNGTVVRRHTVRATVGELLVGLGVTLYPDDRLSVSLDEPITNDQTVYLLVARPIVVVEDGDILRFSSLADSVGAALADEGISTSSLDRIVIEGDLATPDSALAQPNKGSNAVGALLTALRRPVVMHVRRALQVGVVDDGVASSFRTTAETVGEALEAGGYTLHVGDHVTPDLCAALEPGTIVRIGRSLPIVLVDGDRPRVLRSRADTLGALIDSLGLDLGKLDYTRPALDSPVKGLVEAAIVRVYEERYVEEFPIPFETRWEPAPEMEIDDRKVVDWGQEGARRKRILVRYENQQEVYRYEESEWIAREPIDRVFNYGTNIIERVLETPSGPMTYWRKLRMLATSYNAPTAGKPAMHPQYGITRLGLRARKGIVAVDPRVVSLGQMLYVPGYGAALAGDTGGKILWRRIDLCFDDHNLELWYKWVDVYLTTPVPDPEEINWVIPNHPIERE